MRSLIIIFTLLPIYPTAYAQLFNELPLKFPALEYSACAVGDIDKDNDIDFVLSGRGNSTVLVYRNEGNLTFVQDTTGTSIPATEFGEVALADVDLDGDLDLIMNGDRVLSSSPVHSIYLNDGAGNFMLYPPVMIHSGRHMGFDCGDYDNDGDLDVMTGTGWYRNNGDITFDLYRRHTGNSDNAQVEAVNSGSVDWGDYDNDGNLDLLVVGEDNWPSYQSTNLYVQRQNNLLRDSINLFPGISSGAGKWGDFNNDNLLDVAISGGNEDGSITKIYKNNGQSFEEILIANNEGLYGSSLQWGDVDNDGLLDLLVTGSKAGENEFVVKVLKNNGSNSFTEVQELPGVYRGDLKLADFDSDGDLDFIVTSLAERNQHGGIDGITRIYINNTNPSRTSILPPTNLSSEVAGDSVRLQWSENQTGNVLTDGYFYRLEVMRGISERITTHIAYDLSTYFISPTAFLNHLEDGWYYWQVKAVSNAFNESAFSALDSFYVGAAQPIISHSPQDTNLSLEAGTLLLTIANIGQGYVSWTLESTSEWLTVSQASGSNRSTVVISYSKNPGASRTGKLRVIYEDNQVYEIEFAQEGTSIFQEWTKYDLTVEDVASGTSSWGDINRDGYYDWYMSGSKNGYGEYFADHLYTNQSLRFTETPLPDLPSLNYGHSVMADVNNDGWVDLVVTGEQEDRDKITRIFLNKGNNQFDTLATPIPGFIYGSIAVKDFDNDGRVDMMISGEFSDASGPAIQWFRNTPNGFIPDSILTASLRERSSLSPADFDNDGDLDVFVSGYGFLVNENGTFRYDSINLGGGDFYEDASATDINGDGLIDVFAAGNIFQNLGGYEFRQVRSDGIDNAFGEHSWGDIDADGDLDFVGSYDYPSGVLIYENLGDFTFKLLLSEIVSDYEGPSNNIPHLVDINQDKKLDLVYTNDKACCLEERARMFLNRHSKANTTPEAPSNLSDSVNLETAYFYWDKGVDLETTSDALSYNLQVKDAKGNFIVHSNSQGSSLLIPERGLTSSNRWKTVFPKPGRYTWSVQTVDNGLLVSEFSPEKEVELVRHLSFENEATYQAGKIAAIRWRSAFVDSVRISLESQDNLIDIAYDEPKRYDWSIPIDLPPGTYTLYIQDPVSEIIDSTQVTIIPGLNITLPEQNTSQQINRSIEIKWSSEHIDSIRIEYISATDDTKGIVTNTIANEGTYQWVIPVITPGEYLLQISDVASASYDTVRIILQPYLKLVHPAEDSTYYTQSDILVSWQKYFVDSVRVVYQTQQSYLQQDIALTNLDQITWFVPADLEGDSLKIIISDPRSGVTDERSYFFVNGLLLSTNSVLNDKVIVYPNPFWDYLQVDNLNQHLIQSYSLYAVNGQLIDTYNNLRELNDFIKGLNVGVYWLRINSNQSSIMKRLIKQRE